MMNIHTVITMRQRHDNRTAKHERALIACPKITVESYITFTYTVRMKAKIKNKIKITKHKLVASYVL